MTRSNELSTTRRRYLTTLGAGAAAGSAGLAGCAGVLGGDGDELTVAYMPIYPDMQFFVMQEEGYLDEIDADVTPKEFTDGPSIVQAYASGDIDVGLFGIVPSMIVIDRGIEAKVTAANIEEAMMITARDDLAAGYEESGADAFAEFEAEKGRPFRFGTFPEGSVPDILLRYWLLEEQDLTPGEDVEIVGLGGANAVRQALVNEEIDGTSIMEPVPTQAAERDLPFRTIAAAAEFMPGQPAAVTLMTDELRENDRAVARDFLEQHVRATEFIDENPDEAAQHASTVIGEQSLPPETARAAMDSPAANFVSDPRAIENGTEIFAEYAHELGKTERELSLDRIFDYSLYEDVTG